MNLEYWFMFPIAVVIATIAMASGVEGATFFTPLFILGLGLPPEVAIGTGLLTETCGFASGLYAYVRQGLIDFHLGKMLLLVSLPAAILGTWVAVAIPAAVLKSLLGVGLMVIAVEFLRSPTQREVSHLNQEIQQHHNPAQERCLTSTSGQTFCYAICHPTEGRLFAGLGGLFMGMVSTGLGQMNGYFLLQRCRVPSPVAVATSVLVVAVTALTASLGHVAQFAQAGGEALQTVLSLIVFTGPGVILGGQLGSRVASRVSQTVLERAMGILFILVGVLLLGEVLIQSR